MSYIASNKLRISYPRRTAGSRTMGARSARHLSLIRQPTALPLIRPTYAYAGLTNVEKKFLDCIGTTLAFSTDWTTFSATSGCSGSISVPTQGVGESQRLGRTYFLKGIYVKGWVSLPGLEGQANPIENIRWRIALVLDKQTNGTQMLATDVFLATTEDTTAFRNLQEADRFVVLADTGLRTLRPQMVNNGASNSFSWATTEIPIRFSHTFKKPIKVRCTGTANAVASVSDYNISLMGVSNDVLLNLNFDFDSRLRYSEQG